MREYPVRLLLGALQLEFAPIPLVFSSCRTAELFAHKNNKTVGETIRHPKYVGLAASVLAEYGGRLDARLGDFLLELKRAGDPLYKRFLNRHGDRVYCEFRLEDRSVQGLKGLYCFAVGGGLKYIGRSTDSFARRINQGYGRIHPKNCYRDGQSTNCHLNSLVSEVADNVRLGVHPLVDNHVIETRESQLIRTYNPEWNVQLRGKIL